MSSRTDVMHRTLLKHNCHMKQCCWAAEVDHLLLLFK